jgi:hypothetical protein
LHFDPSCVFSGIHFVRRRREYELDALTFHKLAVPLKITRILGEVLVWPELSRIHEDGNYDDV